jgi:tetratricopeptide (TPR) repeat protein
VYYATGQPQRALALFEEALPIRRAVGDRAGEATTLNNMALVYADTGQPQRALELFEEALPIRREVGDRAGEAATLYNLALLLYQSLNRPTEAVQHLQQAIAVLETTGLDRAASGTTVEQMRQALATMQRGEPLGGGGGPSVSAEVMQAIQAFLSAGDWAATRQVVEAQQALLFQPEVEAIFEQNIAHVRSQGEEQAVRMLEMHLAVLRACKQQGIAATFAQIENPPDLPFDPDIIPRSIAALRGGPQEKMTHAQYLTTLATQSDDAQLQALVNTIQTALFGGNLDSLGHDLDGVYAQAWAAIVAGIQEGDTQQ